MSTKSTEGTASGRISGKKQAKSNKPKSDEPQLSLCKELQAEEDALDAGIRTKWSHPYSYDPILVFTCKGVPNGSCYSDRLTGWYEPEFLRAKMREHFGEDGDYYSCRKPAAIQAFLRELFKKPDLVLTRIEEQCNLATGYPVWYFAYAATETETAM